MKFIRSLSSPIIAAAAAGAAWWFWCQFNPRTECGQVLLTIAGGTCGGFVGALGSGWRIARAVSNALAGACSAIILYYSVRGLAVRSFASPASVSICGITAVAFLAGMRNFTPPGQSKTNLIAGRALKVLALAFSIRGVVLLWQ